MPGDPAFQPLRGVVVLDAASWVAGPFSAQMLRLLGASVDRVEPVEGDPLLALDDGPASTARCLYDNANNGKLTTRGDLAALVRERVADVDVLICDWTPARQEALGIDLRDLRRSYPALVVVAVTGYGLTGPYADREMSELVASHAGGEGAILPSEAVARLFPDRPPVRAGRFLADHDAGLTAAVGAAAALVGRRRHGQGELVDVAIVEVEAGLNRTTLSRSIFDHEDYHRGYRGYDYSGNLTCTDGWCAVRPVEEPHWVAMCHRLGFPELIDDPRFADRQLRYDHADALTAALETYTSTRPRAEVRQALLEAGCPGGPFLTAGEILRDPAIASRDLLGPAAGGGSTPTRTFHGRWADPARAWTEDAGFIAPHAGTDGVATDGVLPLSGVRVVDLTWVAAGPYGAELLGFLGADVVKIESGKRPDLFRRPQHGGQDLDSNIRFMDVNQAKRSVELDLKDPASLQRLLRLVAESDVLIENYRPGVRDRLGLSDTALLAANPRLAVVSLSGFGASALDADRPGFASIFNAEGGLGWMTGYPDAAPSDVRDTNDTRAGTNAALATAATLFAVAAGAGGAILDVAARDTVAILQGDLLLLASRGGHPTREGNSLDCAVPYGCWMTADQRWVALSVRTDAEWSRLAPSLRADPTLDRGTRLARRTEIDAAVARWAASLTSDELVELAAAAQVPAGVVALGTDIMADPQFAARHFVRTVDHPRLGPITLLGSPIRVESAASAPIRRPPLLGEHNAEVLGSTGR